MRSLSASPALKLHRGWRGSYVPNRLSQLVCEGDSLTVGFGAGISYPTQLATLLGTDWAVYNVATNAQRLGLEMIADAPTQVDPLSKPHLRQNVLAVWAGTNDLFFNGTVAQLKTDTENYCNARLANRFKVLTFTILPRTQVNLPPTFEASRQEFNTWIRLNFASFSSRLVDLAADSRIGPQGAQDDTTYFLADKIHLNTNGYSVVATIAKSVISSL